MAVTSTVLDAAVALLCVSAAVGGLTLAATDGPTGGTGTDTGSGPGAGVGAESAAARADRLAGTLATSTGSVAYTMAPGASRAEPGLTEFPRTNGPGFHRRDRGTLAALLARAAVRDPTVRGDRFTQAHRHYAREVREAVRGGTNATRFQAVAVWRPYPGAHVHGRVAVGGTPPERRTVHAATLSVPSGAPPAREAALNASDRGFEAVATVLAERLVSTLFPVDRTRQALQDDFPVAQLTAHRYRRAGQLYGVDLAEPLRDERAAAANRRLVDPVAAAVERDLRARFSDPTAAARAVRLDTVRVVVRTWSR